MWYGSPSLSTDRPFRGPNASACRRLLAELGSVLTSINPTAWRRRCYSTVNERPYDQEDGHRTNFPFHSSTKKQETVLYLAYGSNLAARVFQGKRGIKPLSAVNVVVPELVMTFDLPGIPYNEPCFANTAYRQLDSEKTKGNDGNFLQPHENTPSHQPPYRNPTWSKGMVGVVYEVTPADYQHIIATEGGGTAYADVLIDCYPLITGASTVPQNPTTTVFQAHTLYAGLDSGRSTRPHPDYAQPSLRYINLLRDGADEHGFPAEYKAYLHELQPYTVTSRKQAMGAFVLLMLWLPFLKMVFALTARYADDKGRNPPWLDTLSESIFKAVWVSYDGIFHDIFGDGERTQWCNDGEENVTKCSSV